MYELPELPFAYDALEPHIDAATMKVHHQGHHKAYVDKLNKALEKHPDWNLPLEELMARLPGVPEDIRTAVTNNGGGHYNHSVFWKVLTPDQTQKAPNGELLRKIEGAFGGVDGFREKFSKVAAEHFSNGWAWLTADRQGELQMHSTPDHISPLSKGEFPLIVLDVWEHAYYLKHQNQRPAYIEAFWSVLNWKEVGRRWSTFSNRHRVAA